ncbi:MAG TPA: hypothetical protein VES21_03845 [Nocardioidaceae bacterium]|nr:hypothetical protein [Nocardioidaceae bacterium]
MQQLEREEITAQEATVRGEPSLDRGAAASSRYEQAVVEAHERVETAAESRPTDRGWTGKTQPPQPSEAVGLSGVG